MSNDTPNSHNPPIDANDIDAAVNVAYDFGSSQLLVRKLFSINTMVYIFIVGIGTFNTYDTIYFMHGENDQC